MRLPMTLALCLAALSAAAQQAEQATAEPAGAEGGEIVFRSVVGDKPMTLDMRPNQEITPAVEEFRRTGMNPYSGDEAAIAEGKKIYAQFCQMCHLPTGEGRLGPSLRDDVWNHPRLDTDVGRFEMIYGGGAGAMQPFGRRLDQDEILKVMAHINTFRG